MVRKLNVLSLKVGLEDIINSLSDSALLLDNHRKIITLNPPAAKYFNRSGKVLTKKDISVLIPGLSEKVFNQLKRSKRLELDTIAKSKKRIFIDISLSRLKISKKEIYLILIKNRALDKRINVTRDKYIIDLESNTQKLKSLFENVDVLLWSVKQDEKGRLYYEEVNEAFASVTGRTPKDYNGKLLRTLGDGEDFRAIQHSLKKADELKVYTYEKEIEHHSKLKDFIIRLISVPASGKIKYFIGSATDITEYKKIAAKLRISERKYHDLAQYAPIAFSRINALTYKYEYVNNEFVKQSGYTLEEMNNMNREEVMNIVHTDDREKVFDSMNSWVENGYRGVLRLEYRIINKAKQTVWLDAYHYGEFDAENKLTAVNQIYIDITKRKIAEEQIHLLAQAIKSTTDMISITDLDLKFTFVNKSFLENHGYTLQEILGKKAYTLLVPDVRPTHPGEIFEKSQTGGWSGELMSRRKDGSVFPIILSTSPITDKNGRTLGLVGIARDITELKAANEKIKQSLDEKEILLKEVYHRVKNNLQVVTSLLHIQSKTISDPAVLEVFKESQDRIRMMSLIHEKLYKSKDLSKINFSEYIHNLADYLRQAYPTVSKNIDIKIKSQELYLGVDKAIPCGLIINEVISNAYKYAFLDGRKGEINIEFTSPEKNQHKLLISDNGIGFPQDIDFKKAKSMGMVLINTLTEQIDGTVELDNKSGTKFTIMF